MRKFILTIFTALCAGFAFEAASQNVSDLIISEVCAEPDSSGILDDYGKRNGWIEIFNTSQGTVNFGGCYLTDDRGNLTKSLIPKFDKRTLLSPRQYTLFYAVGDGSKGTFYTDFTISKGSTIYLVSNDGKTIIDSLQIPSNIPAGKSVVKLAIDKQQRVFSTAEGLHQPSPMQPNGNLNAETGAQKVAREDPHGFILAIVSIMVVFCALALLWWIFSLLGKSLGSKPAEKKKPSKSSGEPTPEEAAAIFMALQMESGSEEEAAIAMALHLHLSCSTHDSESYVITIRRSQTAWSAPGGNFRCLPSKNN